MARGELGDQVPRTFESFNDLIKARFEIVSSLSKIALHEYESRGYQATIHSWPTILKYAPVGQCGLQAEVSLDFATVGDSTSIRGISLDFPEGPKVAFIAGIAIPARVYINGVAQNMFTTKLPLYETLRSLAPEIDQPSEAAEIARDIHHASPWARRQVIVKSENNLLRHIVVKSAEGTKSLIMLRNRNNFVGDNGTEVNVGVNIMETLPGGAHSRLTVQFEEIGARGDVVVEPQTWHLDAIRGAVHALLSGINTSEETTPQSTEPSL